MKIVKNVKKLNESKEKIPASVVTDLISRAWEEIGIIKANIDQLGKAYSGATKLGGLFQDLLDSYLVYVGQLELFLNDNKLIDLEDTKVIDEKLELNEDAYDKVVINRSPIKEDIISVEPIAEPELIVKTPVSADNLINSESEEVEIDEPTVEPKTVAQPKPPVVDSDFFVDFDEPDLTQPKLTDEDVYGKQID